MKAELNLDIDELAAAITQQVLKEISPLLSLARSEDDIFDVESVAHYLKVEKQWVYQKVHENSLPHYKMGKYPRFRKSEIDKWLEENRKGLAKRR